MKWTAKDFESQPKRHQEKVKLALVELRAGTAMTVKRITERWQMGTWTPLNHLLYWRQLKR